jgi:hypothetical protein
MPTLLVKLCSKPYGLAFTLSLQVFGSAGTCVVADLTSEAHALSVA